MHKISHPGMARLAGLRVPRYDRLQDTMSSLLDNLSAFNWRELVVGRKSSFQLDTAYLASCHCAHHRRWHKLPPACVLQLFE